MSSITNSRLPADPMLPWRFLQEYRPSDSVFDEMLSPAGALRPQCEAFVRSVEAMGAQEFAARRDGARRAIRENGVTYNVYGDPQGIDRPWELDMVPLVVSAEEWSRLERGLLQRTRLLNLILLDLHGPQRLLRSGLLPPSLALASPAFLRPCHGIRVPRDIYLHMHGVDLARSPDGQWVVLADRTQAPSGAGYALENRLVLLHSLPEAFRACEIQRLASFFRSQRDALSALVQEDEQPAKVVLLTPGPYNETYFEHAYLARYLGVTLVEGADLTVRDRRVFIKTLEGLQRVNVIFRRLDDSFCDPLELRGDSFLGVAGLVDAVRAGHVVVANALGAGVIETAAVLPFLPSLCRDLLGEELMLPSVPTWWCGRPSDCAYVLEHLDTLVLKPAVPSKGQDPIFARRLTGRERTELATRIRSKPEDFAAQAHVDLSTAPVWHRERLEPRSVVLRTYVAAAGDSFAVMPGGLTRVSSTQEIPIVSMQRGGKSKDTWILADSPVSAVSLLSPPDPIRLEPATTELPSRVAENLFWLGRYVERAEHFVRLLRTFISRLADQDTTDDPRQVSALVRVLIDLRVLPEDLGRDRLLRKLEEDTRDLIARQGPHTGLRNTLNEVRRLASAVRDRFSIDTWRILNQLHQDMRARQSRIRFEDVLVYLNRIITDLAAFSGMEMENMTRGHGWRFLDLGRRLERSMNLIGVLRGALDVARDPEADAGAARTGHANFDRAADHATADGTVRNPAIVEPLLEIADSSMTYRRRYYAQPRLPPALHLLLADDTNTRGLSFQLAAVSEHALRLPRDPEAPSPTREERLIAHALETLNEVIVSQAWSDEDHVRLDGLLGSIEDDLKALSDAVTHFYFSHAELRVS
jgi:uncharacterized circularly permuted ATP-grasp superfamily protein/uncharacterized alpha-E superfamily protein